MVLCCKEKGFGLEEKACMIRLDSGTPEIELEEMQSGRPLSDADESEDKVEMGLERVVEEEEEGGEMKQEEKEEDDLEKDLEEVEEELLVHTAQTLEEYLDEEDIPGLMLQGRIFGSAIAEIISFTTHGLSPHPSLDMPC